MSHFQTLLLLRPDRSRKSVRQETSPFILNHGTVILSQEGPTKANKRNMTGEDVPYICFDRIATAYEATRYIPPALIYEISNVLRKDAQSRGLQTQDAFLDAGIGTGRFGRYLRQAGVNVTGVDISSEMLRVAKEYEPRLRLVRGDLRSLPFPSGTFSGALAVHILHLIAEWRRVLREVRRVLKPGAPLYLGSESGKQFRVRSLYFQVASEQGFTRPNLGAQSVEMILQYLRRTGAQVEALEAGRFQWWAQATVGETLEMLRQNPFSHMWHVTPDKHAAVMREVDRRVYDAFPSLETVEESPVHFSLWRVTWNP